MKLRERDPLKPASLLSSLTRSASEFDNLATALKMSNRERDIGVFLTTHRQTAYDPSTDVKIFKDMLVEKTDRELVLELCRYCGRFDFFGTLERWEVPVVPVSGKDLLAAGMKSNPKLGLVLKSLRRAWMESGYCLSKEELIGMIGGVLEGQGGEMREEGEGEGGRKEGSGKKRRKLE